MHPPRFHRRRPRKSTQDVTQTKLALSAVVFDLDDTLYPEVEFVVSGFRAVSRYLDEKFGGGKDFFYAMQEVFHKGDRRKVFNAVLQRMGIPEDDRLIARLVTLYGTHEPTIRPFAGVVEMLDGLRSNCRLAMLTDGHSRTQAKKMEALGISQYFDRVIYTYDHDEEWWKPNRRGFDEIQKYLGLSGPQCAYVADNPAKDFYAPNRMGWLTIRIRSKDGLYRDAEAEGDSEAHFEVEETRLIVPLLQSWNGE